MYTPNKRARCPMSTKKGLLGRALEPRLHKQGIVAQIPITLRHPETLCAKCEDWRNLLAVLSLRY